jgi:hypothetical protein
MSPDESNAAGVSSRQPTPLEQAVHSTDIEVLKAAVSNPALTEDLALVLLKRVDLPPELLEQLSKRSVINGRKVKLALASHSRTPRYVSIGLVRQMFTFDLMQMALTPVVPADVKKAAEEALLNRLETLTTGERLSLARRGSGRVAAALLLDPEVRICHAALDNSRLTEGHIIKALTAAKARAGFVQAVCSHTKWSLRREIRMALLRNEKLQLLYALEYAHGFPATVVREILRGSSLPAHIKQRVLEAINE